ncbi:hypothetical protein Dda_8828 [Drechslerella dactyloides]|uniref:DUF7918 domain-containing protein n=1 Tax=Drechslerella dactyloides TaxID=74499 RepID=A0AAD6NFI0_DREDA|nr:hypothetical protein Dda_8828 [Drechslerella dactyloides]
MYKKAIEYNVQSFDNRSTAYVISEEDKFFSFQINADMDAIGATRLDLELWADGHRLDSFTMTENYHEVDEAKVRDQTTGAIKVVKLRFAKLNIGYFFSKTPFPSFTTDFFICVIVDEGHSRPDAVEQQHSEGLGNLELRIWRSQTDAIHSVTYVNEACSPQLPIRKKTVEGQSISDITGVENKGINSLPPPQGLMAAKIEAYDTPWVTFVFRHASKALLQAEGIVPKDRGNGLEYIKFPDRITAVSGRRTKGINAEGGGFNIKNKPVDDDVAAMTLLEIRQEIMRLRKRLSESKHHKAVEPKTSEPPNQSNAILAATTDDKENRVRASWENSL